jgi:hypothetical protein
LEETAIDSLIYVLRFVSAFDLNTREIALLIWLGIGLMWALSKRDIRGSLKDLVRSFFHPVLAIPFVGLWIYSTLGVMLLAHTGLWDLSLLKVTVVWYIASFGLLAAMAQGEEKLPSFLSLVLRNFAVTVFVEFLVNLYTFPLWIEVVLFPVLALLVMTKTLTDVSKTYASSEYVVTKTFLAGCLASVGVVLVVYPIVQTFRHFGDVARVGTVEEFLTPVLLTIWSMPYLYCVGLFSLSQSALMLVGFQMHGRKRLAGAAWRAVLWACHGNIWKTKFFIAGRWFDRFYYIENQRDLTDTLAAFELAWQTRGRPSGPK